MAKRKVPLICFHKWVTVEWGYDYNPSNGKPEDIWAIQKCTKCEKHRTRRRRA